MARVSLPPAEAANQLQILFPALIFNYPSNLIAPPPPLPDTTEYLSSKNPEKLDYLKGGSTKEAMFIKHCLIGGWSLDRAIFKGA